MMMKKKKTRSRHCQRDNLRRDSDVRKSDGNWEDAERVQQVMA